MQHEAMHVSIRINEMIEIIGSAAVTQAFVPLESP